MRFHAFFMRFHAFLSVFHAFSCVFHAFPCVSERFSCVFHLAQAMAADGLLMRVRNAIIDRLEMPLLADLKYH